MLDYIGKAYGTGSLSSLKKGDIVVVKMPKLTKYTKNQHNMLTFFEKMMWKVEMEAYTDAMKQTRANIQNMYHLQWSHCHNSLRDQIRLDPICINMLNKTKPCKQANTTTLYSIVKKLYNGANVVKSPKITMLESLFNLFVHQR